MRQGRESGIELLRIVTMFFIVAHHYVFNSGIWDCFDWKNITPQMEFLQIFVAWGKTGINIFVLISAYFMCTSKLTLKRFLKVFFEAKFYSIVCFVALLWGGYEIVSGKRLFMLCFAYLREVNVEFTGSFLALYLLVPVMNAAIGTITKQQHLGFIGVMLLIYTANATFFFHPFAYKPLGWYVTLYFIAAYLRRYPMHWQTNHWITGGGLVVSVICSCVSIILLDRTGMFHYVTPQFFVNDCQSLFSLTTSVFVFLWFNTMHIGNNRLINSIASTTFGVFLIHTSSDAMRTWLWKDLANVAAGYHLPLGQLVFRSFAIVFGVFLVCCIIDFLRQFIVAKPLQKLIHW